jgi:HSP20 family molecular chaperone IbpA
MSPKRKTPRRSKRARDPGDTGDAPSPRTGAEDPGPPTLGEYLERVLDDFMGRHADLTLDLGSARSGGLAIGPPLEVLDQPTEVVVRAVLPGVMKDDVDIAVADRTITISGTLPAMPRAEGAGAPNPVPPAFFRSASLPAAVDATKTVARLEHGVLEVRLPKKRPAKVRRVLLR